MELATLAARSAALYTPVAMHCWVKQTRRPTTFTWPLPCNSNHVGASHPQLSMHKDRISAARAYPGKIHAAAPAENIPVISASRGGGEHHATTARDIHNLTILPTGKLSAIASRIYGGADLHHDHHTSGSRPIRLGSYTHFCSSCRTADDHKFWVRRRNLLLRTPEIQK